jgi:Ca2+:H+ antiporter
LNSGLGLVVPTTFYAAVNNSGNIDAHVLDDKVLSISRVASIFLMVAYVIYVWFQMRTHHSIYDTLLEADEEKDKDRHIDLHKAKLTFTECIIALAVSITLVTFIAIGLVGQISFVVESRGISDAFVGLILVPLVEKAAEHLAAVDEAWDNQIVGWGLGKPMDLHFEVFDIVVLILAILVVGNFLKDQKSNYLEGALCLIVYIIIAVASYHYPNPTESTATESMTPTE